jgi:hypothetical protein
MILTCTQIHRHRNMWEGSASHAGQGRQK